MTRQLTGSLLHTCLFLWMSTATWCQAQEAEDPIREGAEEIRRAQYEIGEAVIRDFPDDFHALRLMGYVHSSHGNTVAMFECWKRCAELRPDQAEVLDQMARHAMKSEQYKEAIEYWKRALAADDELPGAYRLIGECLLNYGRTDDARRALELAVRREPKSAEAHYLLGEARFQLENFDEAQDAFESAIQLRPNHSKAYYGLVKTCARLGKSQLVAQYAKSFQQLEAAAVAADRQMRKDYDDIGSMREKLANTCLDAGRLYAATDLNRAEELWLRGIKADPANVDIRSLLGKLYINQRNAPKALAQFEALHKLEPDNPSYLRQVSLLYIGMRDATKAEAALRKLIQLKPADATGYRSLAQIYLTSGQKRELAEKLAQRAAQLDPNAESLFIYGWALAANGKKTKAINQLNQALQLDPGHANCERLLKSLKGGRDAG